MVLITGVRPGIGATTVTVNLAAVLGDLGMRVLVVDAAEERSHLSEAAGVCRSEIKHTIADVLAGECRAAEAFTIGPGGMRLLAGDTRGSRKSLREHRSQSSSGRTAQQRLFNELQSVGAEFDSVLLDIGHGLNPWTRRFWLQAQLVLLVSSAEGAALLDAYATIKQSIADGMGPDVRLVINQCDDERVAADVHRRLSDSCQRFLGQALPAVPALPRVVDKLGMPVAPRVWESPNTAFGYEMLWLGRAVQEALSTVSGGNRVLAA